MLTNCEDELVLNNFLSILAKDIENCPQNLVPMTVEKFIKIFSLVEDIKIDLETPLDEEDDEWKLFLEDTPPLGTFEKQFSSLTDKNFRSRRLVFVFCFLFHSSFSVTKSACKRIKEDCAHAFLFVQIVSRGIFNTISP